jgi:hypothetical protein
MLADLRGGDGLIWSFVQCVVQLSGHSCIDSIAHYNNIVMSEYYIGCFTYPGISHGN